MRLKCAVLSVFLLMIFDFSSVQQRSYNGFLDALLFNNSFSNRSGALGGTGVALQNSGANLFSNPSLMVESVPSLYHNYATQEFEYSDFLGIQADRAHSRMLGIEIPIMGKLGLGFSRVSKYGYHYENEQYSLGGAYHIRDGFFVGLTLNRLHYKFLPTFWNGDIYEEDAKSVYANIAASWNTNNPTSFSNTSDITIGIRLQNAFAQNITEVDDEWTMKIPSILTAGVNYGNLWDTHLRFPDSFGIRITGELTNALNYEYHSQVGTGIEISIDDWFLLQGGYSYIKKRMYRSEFVEQGLSVHSHPEWNNNFSWGVGFNIPVYKYAKQPKDNFSIHVNYASGLPIAISDEITYSGISVGLKFHR